MASKGNNVRKKVSDKPVNSGESTKEEKPKQDRDYVKELTEVITANVVGILKPEVDKKMEQVQNILVNEMQDIRQLLPQPQTTNNGDESPIAPLPYVPNQPTYEQTPMQQQQQQQPPAWIQPIIQLLPQLLKSGQPSGDNEIMKMFMQVQLRNNLNRSAYSDWFMDVIMKKVADTMQVEIPDSVKNQSNYLMGNIRKMGTKPKEDTIHGHT